MILNYAHSHTSTTGKMTFQFFMNEKTMLGSVMLLWCQNFKNACFIQTIPDRIKCRHLTFVDRENVDCYKQYDTKCITYRNKTFDSVRKITRFIPNLYQ